MQGMEGLDELERVWRRDYAPRRAVSDFLQDKVRRRRAPAGLPSLLPPCCQCAGGGSGARTIAAAHARRG